MSPLRAIIFTVSIIVSAFYTAAQGVVVSYGSDSNTFCNGGAYLTDSSSIIETSIWWSGGGAVLQQGGYGISGLCPGTYTVVYTMNGTSITESFVVGNNTNDPCAGLLLSLNGSGPSVPVMCDGYAAATASGGSAPYAFQWSSGEMSASINGLCDGVYCVNVVDANGCAVTDCISLGSNGQDSVMVIDNTGSFDSTNVDGTIGESWIEDCEIDFGAIDSAFIQGGVFNAGVVEVTWVFVDTNGVSVNSYTAYYTVGDSLNGYYTVSITIYCPQRVNGINTVSVTDVVALGQSAGLEEAASNDFKLINPFVNQLSLNFQEALYRTISLLDQNGRVVGGVSGFNKDFDIETHHLAKGLYILNIGSKYGTVSTKVLKY